MNPDTVNLLVVFCLAAIVTATALLLRVWDDVKRLDDDVRVTLIRTLRTQALKTQ